MRVNRLQPVLRMSVALNGVMTAVVIACYIWFGSRPCLDRLSIVRSGAA
jgi:hypothetical protein